MGFLSTKVEYTRSDFSRNNVTANGRGQTAKHNLES